MQKYSPAPAPASYAPAPASYAPAPAFSGFGHATGPMGAGSTFAAPATYTPSYSAPAAPVGLSGFSGFGGKQMGGNPAITQGGHRSAPPPPTNFRRSAQPMAGSSSGYLSSL
jgi:hypothetical protein